jgi:hypothetical protein
VRHRHLDYEPGTPVDWLGRAAIDDLLDRGDLADWAPLAAAILEGPYGTLAETVRELCAAHSMCGTSLLWPSWIDRLRQASTEPTELPPPRRLAELRTGQGLTQVQADGCTWSPSTPTSATRSGRETRSVLMRRERVSGRCSSAT